MRITYMFHLLAFALLLSGCAGVKAAKERSAPQNLRGAAVEALSEEPSVVRVPIPAAAFLLEEPQSPAFDRQISVRFDQTPLGTAIRAVAAEWGGNIVFHAIERPKAQPQAASHQVPSLTDPPDFFSQRAAVQPPQIGAQAADDVPLLEKKITLQYRGPVRGLFSSLGRFTGSFFTFDDEVLVVKPEETFSVLVPNYFDLLAVVRENLEKLGARDVGYDELTSRLTFTTDYNGYERARRFLGDLRQNMALVSMQIAIYNVRLDANASRGIDWTRVSAGLRSQRQTPFGNNTGTTGTDDAARTFSDGVGLVMGASGSTILVESARHTISAVLDVMESHGKTEVLQHVVAQTLSGATGRLEALTETPYVSEVGVSSVNDTSTANTAQTSMAKSGVEMEFRPVYSATQGTLTLSLHVGVHGVNRFIALDAGTLGRLTQPETTRKSITTTLRMSPYQTAIIGGLVFDRNAVGSQGLPLDTYATKSVNRASEREELVVLVKPQVFEFVPIGSEELLVGQK